VQAVVPANAFLFSHPLSRKPLSALLSYINPEFEPEQGKLFI